MDVHLLQQVRFLVCVICISEWIVVVVAWHKCAAVISWCIGPVVLTSALIMSVVFLGVRTISRDVSWLVAVVAESFPKVLSSFFVSHCIDGGGHTVNVHSVGIVSLLRLVVSSLVSWSRGISSSINLLEFVGGETLLSSRRFAWLVVADNFDVVSVNPVEFDGDGVPSFLRGGVFKGIRFLV